MIALLVKDARLSWDALRPVAIAALLYLLVAFLIMSIPASALPLGLPFRNLEESLIVPYVVFLVGAVAFPTWSVHCIAWGDARHGAATLDGIVPVSRRRRAASKMVVAMMAAGLPGLIALLLVPTREHAILAERLIPMLPRYVGWNLHWYLTAAAIVALAVAPAIRSRWLAIAVAHVALFVAPILTGLAMSLGFALLVALNPLVMSKDALKVDDAGWAVGACVITALASCVAAAATTSFIALFGSRGRRLGTRNRILVYPFAAHLALCVAAPLIAFSACGYNESSAAVRAWRAGKVSDAALLSDVAEWFADRPARMDRLVEASRRVKAMSEAERAGSPLAQALGDAIAAGKATRSYERYLQRGGRIDPLLQWVIESPNDALALVHLRVEFGQAIDPNATIARNDRAAWHECAEGALDALFDPSMLQANGPDDRSLTDKTITAIREAIGGKGFEQ